MSTILACNCHRHAYSGLAHINIHTLLGRDHLPLRTGTQDLALCLRLNLCAQRAQQTCTQICSHPVQVLVEDVKLQGDELVASGRTDGFHKLHFPAQFIPDWHSDPRRVRAPPRDADAAGVADALRSGFRCSHNRGHG